jgi:hypothetical protein
VDAYYKIVGINGFGAATYYLLAISEWGGKTRGLFIYMGRRNHSGGTVGIKWNFPNTRSFWQRRPSTKGSIGGANYAYIKAEDLGPHIGGCIVGVNTGCIPNDGISYRILVNLAGAFEYANDLGLWDTSISVKRGMYTSRDEIFIGLSLDQRCRSSNSSASFRQFELRTAGRQASSHVSGE